MGLEGTRDSRPWLLVAGAGGLSPMPHSSLVSIPCAAHYRLWLPKRPRNREPFCRSDCANAQDLLRKRAIVTAGAGWLVVGLVVGQVVGVLVVHGPTALPGVGWRWSVGWSACCAVGCAAMALEALPVLGLRCPLWCVLVAVLAARLGVWPMACRCGRGDVLACWWLLVMVSGSARWQTLPRDHGSLPPPPQLRVRGSSVVRNI